MGRGRSYTFADDEDDEEEDDFGDERAKKRRSARQRTMAVDDDEQTSTEAAVQEKQKVKRPPQRKAPEPGEILTVLREADLLPCLYFLPGRRVVEEAAMSAALHLFTSEEEQELIKAEIGIWLEQLPKEDRNLQQVYSLTELL